MDTSKQFVKGFNSGYIIRKNHPVLMKNLIKGAKGDSELLKGLKAGGAQFEKEMKLKLDQFHQRRKQPSKGKDRGFEI